jgi:NAD(P)H-hydrate epimerase
MRSLSRLEVRDVDRRAIEEYGLPGIVLMENAGRGAAEVLLNLGIAGPVVICAGKGNNGGDGFVMARHLERRGIDVRLLLFCSPAELTGDARINYRPLERAGMAGTVLGKNPDLAALGQALSQADWIIDALLGTGMRGIVQEPLYSVITAINASHKRVLAMDLPSGLDCDTGQPLGCAVRASETVTFVARKLGFDQPAAAAWIGRVHVVEIGVPTRLLQEVAGTQFV